MSAKESKARKLERALKAVALLEEKYPVAVCSLTYTKPHELMIAGMLSAQCTDARVNIVTKDLFAKYTSIADFAAADPADIEPIIRSCGFFRTKSKNIVGACRRITDVYGGEIPSTIDDLVTLPGIGRKVANLILGDVFGLPAYVCDTHCIRICGRLGLTSSKDPVKTERELRELIPPEKSSDFCHRLVLFGREVCKAPTPRCGGCELRELCPNKPDKKK